jgi:hypothetical protein
MSSIGNPGRVVMLCRVCFRAEASMHVLDRPSCDGLIETHYCLACYDLKYVNPPTGWIAVPDDSPPALPPAFPMRRFAIRDMMIVAGFFAVLNAALALFVRSGLIRGTPAHVQERAIEVFLVANSACALLLAEIAIFSWLRKRYFHKITGGSPPDRLKGARRLTGRIAWEGASPLERVLLILCLTWPFTWLFWLGMLFHMRVLHRILYWTSPLVFTAALPLIVLGIETVLLGGLFAAARRR